MSQMYRINTMGSAVEQLEWAIHLLVELDAPLPAVTLAAAAEEPLGKMLTGESATAQLRDGFVASVGLPPKVVADEHINRLKNWLKHGSKTEPSIVVAPEAEAVQYIARALTNLLLAGGPRTPMADVFERWADARPHLTE